MPTTANEALRDALIRHQIYLLRYSGFVRNEMAALLEKTEERLAERIRDRLRNTRGLNTPAEVKRMQTLLEDVARIRQVGWSAATDFLINEMVGLSAQEPLFAQGMFAANSTVVIDTVLPPARQLRAIALERPFEGRILKDWAETMRAEDIRRIHSAIQLGMVAGEDSATIARRVIGTRVFNGTDGVTEVTRRQVQAITRTAVQAVANGARDEFFQENADVIEAELFVATLDSRTTPICRALDGKRFEVGKGPRPPMHFACRSLRVASFDADYAGSRPAKASTRKQLLKEFSDQKGLSGISDREDLPKGSKGQFDLFERKRIRELTGQVPAATSYNEWLKGQSKAFQDEILGVTKAKLFRDGGLSLDKYVAVNGSELSLSQLAAKYGDAFKRAGLDPKSF